MQMTMLLGFPDCAKIITFYGEKKNKKIIFSHKFNILPYNGAFRDAMSHQDIKKGHFSENIVYQIFSILT